MDNNNVHFAITPEDEARLERLTPPRHQVVVPSPRRRAHTVEVEYGGGRNLSSSTDEQERLLSHSSDPLDDDDDISVNSLEEDLVQPPRRRSSLSVEFRQRRQQLLGSRCVRGFLALGVYGVLVLHRPSMIHHSNSAGSLPPQPQLAVVSGNNQTAQAVDESPRLRMAALPKFHHKKYHSTIPPSAVRGVTHTNGTTTHWHKIPPTIYHKKHRPILSHAHSYQLHQEPLVFGREQSASFLQDSEDEWYHFNSSWFSTLVTLSLIALLADTSYREWQHYRWQHLLVVEVSPQERQRRRSSHHRRSPSPEPRRRRFDSF